MQVDIQNMTEKQRHQHIVNLVIKQVSETRDFDYCKNNYTWFYRDYPECREVIMLKLFELSRVEGALSVDNIKQLVDLFDKYSVYWKDFLLKVFNEFEEKFIRNYEIHTSESKNLCIENEAKKYLAESKTFLQLSSIYGVFIKIFPNLKTDIEDALNILCYTKGKLDESKANSFASLVGCRNVHVRFMLNEYLKKSIKNFIISAMILTLSICIMANTDQWWVVGIFGVTMLAMATVSIQYLVILFSAIGNYFKDKNFRFNNIIMVYEKKNGKGRYKATEIK